MRVFALSDIHVDYADNKQWIANLSRSDYRDDVLIVGGDVSHSLRLLEWCLRDLARCFARVLYVPGNHDLWVVRDRMAATSLEKFQKVRDVLDVCDVSMQVFKRDGLSIVPLLSWYDYTFGEPSDELLERWMDFRACHWPHRLSLADVVEYFARLNDDALGTTNDIVISFSHFLPRIDLMPSYVPDKHRMLYPILGTTRLESQIRTLNPRIHVYGHSHLNRRVMVDGIAYINNAFGYPHESALKQLVCLYEC